MYILSFLHALSFIVNFYLSFYIFTKDPKSLLNKSCSSLLLCFSLWNFCEIFIKNPDLPFEISLLFYKISSIGFIGIVSFFAIFALAFLKKINEGNKIYLYLLIFAPSVFFITQQWLGNRLFILKKHEYYGFVGEWDPTFWSLIYLIYIFLIYGITLYLLLIHTVRSSDRTEKSQGTIILTTTLASISIIVIIGIILPLMQIYSVPPVGDLCLCIWSFGLVFSMTRYRFLEITPITAVEEIISTMPDCLILLDKEGRFSAVNKQVLDLLRYEEDELRGRPVDLIIAENRSALEISDITSANKDFSNKSIYVKTKNGKEIPVRFSKSTIYDNSGNIIGLVCIASDMTQYKEVEATLKESKKFYRTLVESSPDIIFDVSTSGIINALNPAFEITTGWPVSDWVDESFIQLLHPEDRLILSEMSRQLFAGEPTTPFELRIAAKSGEFLYEEIIIIPQYKDGDITGIIGFAHDITRRKKYEEQLRHLAYHDTLTGLPNRKSFNTQLNEHLVQVDRNGTMGAVLYVDLDNFKIINDSYGHDIGDILLQEVSKKLMGCIRKSDQAYRIGGDEFLVLLRNISHDDDSGIIAQKIIKSISDLFSINEKVFYISPSIGISVFPRDGMQPDMLLKYADDAMYRVKETGKNNYQFYNDEINSRAEARITIRNDLIKAIEEEQFDLHYQPIIKDNKIIGTEALLYWSHPHKGHIKTGDFIPIAEESGLIHKIGEWVLLKACKKNREWHDMGYSNLYISINISAKQFKEENLISLIDQTITESGLDPEFLTLEITESCIIEDVDIALDKMNQINKRGIKIAMDDFGTGFSSLSGIKSYPLNTLKIDKSFTANVVEDPRDQAIVKATIEMAKGLNLDIVAEGVETKEQLYFMALNGCSIYQGYLFCKPIPADEIELLLKTGIKIGEEVIKIN